MRSHLKTDATDQEPVKLQVRTARTNNLRIQALALRGFCLGMFSVISTLTAGLAGEQLHQSMIVGPKPSSWEDFPKSTVTAEGILTLKAEGR